MTLTFSFYFNYYSISFYFSYYLVIQKFSNIIATETSIVYVFVASQWTKILLENLLLHTLVSEQIFQVGRDVSNFCEAPGPRVDLNSTCENGLVFHISIFWPRY